MFLQHYDLVIVVIGSIGAMSSFLACIAYPLVQKVQKKKKGLKRFTVTLDGKTITAEAPTEVVERILSLSRKYQSEEVSLGQWVCS